MKLISQVISWVCLPLFMPMYALLFVMYVPSNQDFLFNEDNMYLLPHDAKMALLYMFGVFCVIAPGASFIILRRRNIISDIEMDNRKERNIPIMIMLVYCLVLFFLFKVKASNTMIPKFVFSLPLSGVFVTAVFYIANYWKKISIHAAGGGILVGFILAYILIQSEYQLWILAFAFLISGVIMTARLYLEKHTMLEVIIGWFTATIITFTVNYLY
jgi:membrane-associated phospholipid phosphatase